MNDNVEIIRSNKGGMKIIHRGYMYTVHKKRQGGGIRWRCTQRSLHCKGSISTGNGPPSVNMPHNHIPDPHSVALARCRQLEEFPDIASLLETEYDDLTDSMQRALAPQVQIPNSDSPLHSQPLSPTKLKLSRPNLKAQTSTSTGAQASMDLQPEEVCLRWNSHHSNMQTSFPQLLEKEQYVDVTLMAEGKTFKCHKIILSSCSVYFEEVFSDITPSQHPVIILKGIPFWILKALIDFMYVGEVNIDQNKLSELLDVAELLKVKGLAGKNTTNPPAKESTSPKKEKPTVPPPVTTKVEETLPMPICDPLELLEPKFNEGSNSPLLKIKENRSIPKKVYSRKIRKRKLPEQGASPPMFPMRRGTRSRPNVKIPKYYDYEDIVKPTSSTESQPFSSIVTIKSEPPDIEEVDMLSYSESNSVEKTPAPERSPSSNEEKKTEAPVTKYKIKIKSISSMSNVVEIKENGETAEKNSSPSITEKYDKKNGVFDEKEDESIEVGEEAPKQSMAMEVTKLGNKDEVEDPLKDES